MTEMRGAPLVGTVTEFDAHVGLGHIATPDGATFLFHCVGIADGTRTIEVGAPVVFERLAKMGRVEATAIRPA